MLPNVIYQFWASDTPMSDTRKACFEQSKDVFGVPVSLVTSDSLYDYAVTGHPIHRCYEYLSPNHKSDYARCYLLRFHGGGYADIKRYSRDNNWAEQFELLRNTPYADIVGEPENTRWAAFSSYRHEECASRLIIAGYMIARENSPFMCMWYDWLTSYLDFIEPVLKAHPSPNARSCPGYPVPYFGVTGFPYHYTCNVVAAVRKNAVLRSLRSGRTQDSYR